MGLSWQKKISSYEALGKSLERVNQVYQKFQVANLIEDYPILEEARKVAVQVVTTPNWREHSDWHCLSLHLEQKEHLD